MSFGNTLNVKSLLESNQIARFYQNWEEPTHYLKWGGLWRKQFKVVTRDGYWIKLNTIRPRLGFRNLKRLLVDLAPVHVYCSVLDFLQPERVRSKKHTQNVNPVGGMFVVDIDHYMNYQRHQHRTEQEGFCYGCLENSKQLTLEVLSCLECYYNDIHLMFSGKNGFHIHVRDFKIQDWTYYDSARPWKSHEVARRKLVTVLKEHSPRAFDHAHYVLSVDTMRVITLPESLNGETGLICRYLGAPDSFREQTVSSIVEDAKRMKHIIQGLNWLTAKEWKNPRFNLLHTHHEPTKRMGSDIDA